MIDEVRVSDVARSAAWIKFEYYNIAEADNEQSYGSEEGMWLSGWTYRKKVTVQSANVDADLTDFPLYVGFSADSDIGGGVSDTTDGTDIRFTSSDGVTELPYERESFTVSAGDATGDFWV